MGHGVPPGPGDLRGAAHGVRVLHARRVVLVVPGELRTLQHGQHVGGAGALAGVRPDGVQLGREDLLGAEQRLERQGGGDVGGLVQVLEVGERHDEHAQHAVGAVQKGETLLLAQLDGRDAVGGEQLAGGGDDTVGPLGVAFAHQRQGAVAERREVAGAPEGPVLVHDGRDPGVEHVGHGLRDLGPHTGVPGADGFQPQEHERAHDFPLDARAHSRRMRADDVPLQLSPQLLADVPGGERAEPGGDPVHGLGLRGQRVHDRAGRGKCGHRLFGELDPGIRPRHGDDIRRADAGRPHHHSVHIHIQERTR